MSVFWTAAWEALTAVLLPTPCVTCGALVRSSDPPLCAACWRRAAAHIDAPVCGCGSPLATGALKRDRCGRCRRGLSPFTTGFSLGPFEGPLRDAIVAFKYAGRHRTARGLAARLARHERCASVLANADFIVPVPLHKTRERRRGFNQSRLFAEALGRAAVVPVAALLTRTRDTPSQTDLDARQRRVNVRGAFACADTTRTLGRTIVLVDDVVTTGATLRECARILVAAGAKEIRVVTAARAE